MARTVRVIVNGVELDPSPRLWQRNGRIYVPVRQIVQRLGAQVRLETAAACAAFDPRSGRTAIIGGFRPAPDAPLIAPVERVAAAGGARFLWEPDLSTLIIQRPEASLAGRRIALDPGHGGPDLGYARPDGPVEKDCNLAVARWLHALLGLAGARPVLTRTHDRRRAPARVRRTGSGRRNGGPLAALVSIHHNSHWDAALSGCETYFYHSAAGQRLAHCLQEEAAAELGVADRGVREAAFDELRHCAVPAALCKLAFLSNPAEAAMAAAPGYGLRAALGLFRGLRRFFEQDLLG